jgi:hypothetical protein
MAALSTSERVQARLAAKREALTKGDDAGAVLVELKRPSFRWVLDFAFKWTFAMIPVAIVVAFIWALIGGFVLGILGSLAD